MKKLFILFCCLQLAFGGLWIVKATSPESRPDPFDQGIDSHEGAWWLAADDMPEVGEEWKLDPEIPLNYVPVLGEKEVYMVIGEDGNIEGYRKRTQQEDGSWLWEDINLDNIDIPENYESVEGIPDVYKVTNDDGSVKYLKYIRNDDDTYCFIDVDKNGNEINASASDGMQIPENYRRIKGNIYAVINEDGVVIGYKERVLNKNGSYEWIDCEKPDVNQKKPGENTETPVAQPEGNEDPNEGGSGITVINPKIETETIAGGGYKETETIIDRKNTGGWIITYQTIVTRTYDNQGKLLSTKKDGPQEISKVQEAAGNQAAPNPNEIAPTISAEYNRITAGLSIRNDIGNDVLAKLNAERSAEGMAPLSMSSDSDVYKIACMKAADMAIYNHADYDSPLYGDISSMINRFGIASPGPSETLWKATGTKTANDIHVRFQAQEISRKARMNKDYSSIGIGIVEKNGYLYIAEILI